MSAQKKRNIATFVVVILLIIFAEFCRYFSRITDDASLYLSFIRSFVYIFIFSAWCISISRKIIQKQAKRYLVSIAALMVFWVVAKTLKHTHIVNIDFQRNLWYLYYLPIVFISFFSMLSAFHIGRAEDFKLPKWTTLLYIPTTALVALVLTNDLHFLTFSFPYGINHFETGEYKYGVVFFLVVIWCVICYLTAFVVIVLRAIVNNKKKKIWLPVIPVLIGLIYFALNFVKYDFIRLISGDFSTFTCLVVASVFECFFVTRLIHTNSGYGELFKLSTVSGQIADKNLEIRLTSKDALPLTEEQIKSAIEAPVMLENNIRLDAEKIRHGYVLWQEDMSSLIDTIEKLDEINVELEDYYSILREETAQKQEMLKIKEQNSLYTRTEQDTAQSIKEVSSILLQISMADDYELAKHLLKKSIVICAYIKRRTNMIFVLNQLNCISYMELKGCFDESVRALDNAGIECAVTVDECDYTASATVFYDFFEAITEKYYEYISAVLVNICSSKITITLSADCDALTVSDFPEAEIIRDDDGVYYCSLYVGGEADD